MDEKKKRAALHNLGCKVNGCETEAMAALLREAGYETVAFTEEADVYVINTCTVTNIADRKSRQMLRRARHLNPDAVIVAAGCYAQAAGEKLLEDGTADILIGNDRKAELPGMIDGFLKERKRRAALIDIAKSSSFEEMPGGKPEHARAFLKIEDGCNQFCSYCLIPYVRGRVRSRDPEAVAEEAEILAEEGFREIVLTGIHLSSYGIDRRGDAALGEGYGEPLLALIGRLEEIPGISRIRLGSLEPRIITPAFTSRLRGYAKVCPHFHLSLQSGSDTVLRRMNRHYTAEEYYRSLCLLREAYDRPGLTTDVIAGFPGETEEEFEETVAFLKKAALFQTHIFRYSRRKGTAADRMEGHLDPAEIARRSRVLAELNRVNRGAYEQSFLGETREILPEEPLPGTERDGSAEWVGHTPEYLKLKVRIPDGSGRLPVPVRITKDCLMEEEE